LVMRQTASNPPRCVHFLSAWLLFGLLLPSVWGQRLPSAKPSDAGMSPERLERLTDLVQTAVDARDFPGAVLVVGRWGRIVYRKAFGLSQWRPEPRPMQPEMIFDIASMTKPVATATAVMLLVEQGKLRLEDKVSHFIPEFKPFKAGDAKNGGDIRLWHLLTHTSGLPPYVPAPRMEKKLGSPCSLAAMTAAIAEIPRSGPPGEAFDYSCLGYITLARIVQEASGQDLDDFCRENIFAPLGMNDTMFRPPEDIRSRCVPTTYLRGILRRGVVHDPLAHLLGGLSGNAGLFSTADDLAVFAQMILNGGVFEGVRILSPLTVERMRSVYPRTDFSGRGLGWDLHSPYASSGGDLFGPAAFGHTGYTGTSMWLDPETGTFVIFLTNRVHPNEKGEIVSWRSKVANVVAASIIDLNEP